MKRSRFCSSSCTLSSLESSTFLLVNLKFSSFEEHFCAFCCAGCVFHLIFELFFIELSIHIEILFHQWSLIIFLISLFLPKSYFSVYSKMVGNHLSCFNLSFFSLI